MLNFILPLVVLFIYILKSKRRRATLYSPAIFLIFLYFLSISCGIADVYMSHDNHILRYQYFPYAIVFIGYLLIFLIPFTSYNEKVNNEIALPPKHTLDLFSTVIIVLSFIAIGFYSSGVTKVFSMANLADARNNRYIYEDSYVEAGLLNTICSVSASLFVISLLLFFIYLCIGNSKKRCLLLLISSFSEILHVLTEVGRDGVVFWLFNFIFLYLLFRDYLPKHKKATIKKLLLSAGGIILIPFMLISMSRFEGNVMGDLISYMGQQFKHFCYYFDFEPLPVSYGRSFPLFFEVTGQSMPPNASYANIYTDSTTFATFIRGFFTNFGMMGTIACAIVMGTIFKITMGDGKPRLRFNTLFVYLLYFQIYGQGVFYFRQYTRGGNLFIVICFFFYYLFKNPCGNHVIHTVKNK